MDLVRYFSVRRNEGSPHHTNSSNSKDGRRSYLPVLANPINEDVRGMLSSSLTDIEKSSTAASAQGGSSNTSTLAGDGRTSRGNVIIYKQHHEASTIELFYDLFFVANLAYFTDMHQHTDAESLINYLKLFTLMWFTWLATTLFDVRFSIDCVWNRLHKAIQFGVFTGFVFAGPVFDKYNNTHDRTGYKHFAIVLVVSRAAIAIQYAVVMWQGRMFRQTLVPLGLSTLVHAAAAVAYGIIIAALPRGDVGLEEQITLVVISIVEGLLIFLIAIIWRILSFKYTHLVERLQLLTLIIIGEGIIGMVKSVAGIFKMQSDNNATEVGTVVAAMLLLYLLYMLYFDQFSSDRFGTVRQQIWSLLHYPLHMAILLCVEGNTSLIVWNSAVQGLKGVWSLEIDDYSDPGAGFNDTNDLLSNLNQSMWTIDSSFAGKYWNATYKWQSNFTAIENYTTTYGFRSPEWNDRTGSLIRYIFDNAQVFVFEAHTDTMAKLNAVSAPATDPRTRLNRIYDVFNTTVMQFYIGAGAVLLVLAVMYWFNKLHKSKYEFGEMINRVIVGFALLIVGVAAVVGDKSTTGFKFAASNWIIPIVVLSFATVLLMDNLLMIISSRISHRHHHKSRHHHHRLHHLHHLHHLHPLHPRHPHHPGGSWGASTLNESSDDTADLISKHHPHTPTHTPRSGASSTSLSHIPTAYTPYNTPPQGRDFTPAKVRFDVPSNQPRAPDNGIRAHPDVEETLDDGELSYQHTPVDVQGLGIGIRTEQKSDRDTRHKKGSPSGYESLEDMYQSVTEGQEWVQYPKKTRTRRDV